MQIILHRCTRPHSARRLSAPLHLIPRRIRSTFHPFAMAVTRSSSGSSAMKASLVLMLLFGAVVAAHAKDVYCENKSGKLININGVDIDINAKVKVDIDGLITLKVVDKLGNLLERVYLCPADVSAIVVVYVDGLVKIKVAAVGLIGGLLNTLVGLVLGVLKCDLY